MAVATTGHVILLVLAWITVGEGVAVVSPQTSISNPLICLLPNQGVLFDVSSTSVPEYDRDNLLNTNSNFDSGSFDVAATKVQASGATSFAYTFTEPGNYFFRANADATKQVLIVVLPIAGSCPDPPIMAVTQENLITLGVVSKNTDEDPGQNDTDAKDVEERAHQVTGT